MRLSALRPFLVALVSTVLAALGAHRLLIAVARPLPRPVLLDALVLRGCLLALAICLLWLWLVVLTCALDALRERATLPRRAIPRRLRHLVLIVCGATLAVTASPAGASTSSGGTEHGQDTAAQVRALVAGLPLPDRTTDRRTTRPSPSPQSQQRPPTAQQRPQSAEAIEVRPGDSLWRITERLLPDADPARVARGWQELYRANRDAIGADPGLIRPGTLLTVPAELDGRRR